MSDHDPCKVCGRVGPRMLTSDEINRRVDAVIGYRFAKFQPSRGRSIRGRSIRAVITLLAIVAIAVAVAVRVLVRP